jgi:hypothetical protein
MRCRINSYGPLHREPRNSGLCRSHSRRPEKRVAIVAHQFDGFVTSGTATRPNCQDKYISRRRA